MPAPDPLDIETVFPRVRALIAADATCAALPLIDQLDREYNNKYTAALKTPGMVFALWSAGGYAADGNDNQQIRLDNELILSVIENTAPGKNTSGLSALQWVRRLLRVLHGQGLTGGPRNRATIRHSTRSPAFELGEMGEGLVIYFINLSVDSVEPTGALPPPATP